MNTDNIVMWVILRNNADFGRFQDSDFAGDLEDSKSSSGGTCCAFWDVIRSFQLAGCLRNKLQVRTAQQNQESFSWMHVQG